MDFGAGIAIPSQYSVQAFNGAEKEGLSIDKSTGSCVSGCYARINRLQAIRAPEAVDEQDAVSFVDLAVIA